MIQFSRDYNNNTIHLLPEVEDLLISLQQAISNKNNILLAGRSGLGRKSCL